MVREKNLVNKTDNNFTHSSTQEVQQQSNPFVWVVDKFLKVLLGSWLFRFILNIYIFSVTFRPFSQNEWKKTILLFLPGLDTPPVNCLSHLQCIFSFNYLLDFFANRSRSSWGQALLFSYTLIPFHIIASWLPNDTCNLFDRKRCGSQQWNNLQWATW